MNRPIRLVSIFTALLFAALLINITVNYVARTDDLLADSRNVRVRDAQFGAPRGPILAANTPIVSNVETGERPFAYQRTYLDGPVYAPITGYFSYIYGRSGIEDRYNAELVGQADSQFVTRLIDIVSGRQHQGGVVQTTISPKIQQAAWDALNGYKGAAMVLDYETGAVLAWVSTPSYDPSRLSDLSISSTVEAWEEMMADPSRPLNDRGASEIYPPGSTFKMVVAAAALEKGYRPDTMIDTPAQLRLPGTSTDLPNEAPCGNDKKSLDEAYTLSCNTTFANIGMDLGADVVRAQAEKFGFGTDLQSDFLTAASVFPSTVDSAQLAMSSIGQFDVAASPLQMAVVAAGIANEGRVMQPYVVSQIRTSNETIVSSHEPTLLSQAMTKDNAATLAEMMGHVVTQGTGRGASVEGMHIAGKTGTAEHGRDADPYSWFAGFSRDSHVALAVFLEEPDGQVAANLASQIFEATR